MGDVHEGPRPRIATSHLAQHLGQRVCFVGRVEKVWPIAAPTGCSLQLQASGGCRKGSRHIPRPAPLPTAPIGLEWQTMASGSRDRPNLRTRKIHPSGKLFILSDGEGKNTTVELSEPLDEELSGVIEVVGRVTNQATIMCMSYVQFREDKSAFDLALYNEALKIIHEFPEYFPFGVTRND
ncbi:Replication protein A 14 kDa subunit [Chelonia mydas]|uniref:Replication protein A 14 kDa subunit n=1 Tax=Chelonia mydas TaxID=8469 RepID=M7BX56_CHEMY|nr:Replication protein A 14 kDa subunit [Chelonia mydas]